MRKACLCVALSLLLIFMWLYHTLIWTPVMAFADYLSKHLHALDVALLTADAERRTRNERKLK